MSAEEPSQDDIRQYDCFSVALAGRSVQLLLHPREPEAAPPALEAVVAALRNTPLKAVDRGLIERALAEHADVASNVHIEVGKVAIPEHVEGWTIVVSEDGLAAYAVPPEPPAEGGAGEASEPALEAPTEDSGEDASGAPPDAPADDGGEAPRSSLSVRERLSAAQVIAGLLDEVIDELDHFEGEPAPRKIRCLALGVSAASGIDGTLELHFDPHPSIRPAEREDGSIDFHSLFAERFVEAEALLATRTPAVAGSPGWSVLGATLEAPAVADIDLERVAGANTSVRGDEVVATISGRPVLSAQGVIEVVPGFVVTGDVDYSVGNIQFPGDVLVHGDVKPGFSIVAGGSVVVRGLVEGASITAGRDLSLAGTIGRHTSVFEVGGDLSARYLHTTDARVGGVANVAQEIVNCTLTAERVSTSSRGRIVGGLVSAHTQVDCGSIGSREEILTKVRVSSALAGSVIRVRQSTHARVVVQIGEATREIQEELQASSFWEVAGGIVALPASADETLADQARATPVIEAA